MKILAVQSPSPLQSWLHCLYLITLPHTNTAAATSPRRHPDCHFLYWRNFSDVVLAVPVVEEGVVIELQPPPPQAARTTAPDQDTPALDLSSSSSSSSSSESLNNPNKKWKISFFLVCIESIFPPNLHLVGVLKLLIEALESN